MCLSVPATIVSVTPGGARADVLGNRMEIGTDLVEDLRPGDRVLVHAGFAIARIDDDEAEATEALWRELEEMGLEAE